MIHQLARVPDGSVRLMVRAVILPSRNERDVEDVPEELRFIFVDDAEEVLRQALTPVAAGVRPAA